MRLADVVLRESVWSNVDLAGRHLSGFRCRDTRFERCDLSGAVLDSASLTRVTFTECRMTGVVLSATDLQDVRIQDSRADMANLRMARANFLLIDDSSLREAEFYSATLVRSALLGCDLHSANFRDCSMDDVDLHDSTLDDIRGALSLRGANISQAQLVALTPSLLADAGINITQIGQWRDDDHSTFR